jgi:site-specific DNA recombinase
MKVFGYCRISVANDEGVSLCHQQDRIKAWAAAHGHELVQIFTEIRSAGRVDNRPELQRAMAAVCKERGSIICFYALSRFSRSVRDTLALAERLEAAGAHLCSLNENLDTTTAMGRMFFQLVSVMSQFERDQLRERTTHAMGHLRRSNRRISAKIPFGHRLSSADGMTLLPDAEEQAAIARIMERRAAGMTLAAIAQTMVDEGVKTREGGRWSAKTIYSIHARQQKLAA